MADLTDGEVFTPPILRDDGGLGTNTNHVTGTLSDGTAAAETCGDWTLTTPGLQVEAGGLYTDNWGAGRISFCSSPTPLICIEAG